MKKKSSAKKISQISKRASNILAAQKKEYKTLLSEEIKKLGFKQGRKEAASKYRKMYGGTPQLRWQHALQEAANKVK